MNLHKRLANKLENVSHHGHYFSCSCPFHSDSRPSMMVWPDYFRCYGCDVQGNLEYLEHNLLGIPTSRPKSSIKAILPKWKSWEERYGGIEKIAIKAHQNVLDGNDMYFKKRKIDQFITQGRFGILDRWALFPVLDSDGNVIDIVVRSIKQKNVKYVIRPYSESESRPLYVPNWERCLKSQHIFLVYGIVTAWALEAINLPVITGITGKSVNPNLLDGFQKPIFVLPDYHEEFDGVKLVTNLGWRGKLCLVDYPDNCEDLDDVRVKHGNDALRNIILEEVNVQACTSVS